MNKALSGLMCVAFTFSGTAQENTAKTQENEAVNAYNQVIVKQLEERKEAFKQGIQKDEKALNEFLTAERERVAKAQERVVEAQRARAKEMTR